MTLQLNGGCHARKVLADRVRVNVPSRIDDQADLHFRLAALLTNDCSIYPDHAVRTLGGGADRIGCQEHGHAKEDADAELSFTTIDHVRFLHDPLSWRQVRK